MEELEEVFSLVGVRFGLWFGGGGPGRWRAAWFGGSDEVLFETGNDLRPPDFGFDGSQLEFDLLVGIELGVELFLGLGPAERAAGMAVLSHQAEGPIVVG